MTKHKDTVKRKEKEEDTVKEKGEGKEKEKGKKEKGSRLEKRLTFSPGSIWEEMDEIKVKICYSFCDEYLDFISRCKTERDCIEYFEGSAVERGFRELKERDEIKPGDKVYLKNREKNLILFHIGKEGLKSGMNIIGAHVDSPRLDLKPNPVTEDADTSTALLRTHYYGGLRKYHWVNIPLALYGKVVKDDGEEVRVAVGDGEGDPVLAISDLLPHLSKKQRKRRLNEGIKGEELRAIAGTRPVSEKGADKGIKLMVLKLLNENYGIVEEDLVSSDLELVPAGKAREVGLDRSLVGAYGQDDRICSFLALRALFDIGRGEGPEEKEKEGDAERKTEEGKDESEGNRSGGEVTPPDRTAVCVLFDREEVGSDGTTGVKSRFLYNAVGELLEKSVGAAREIELRRLFERSFTLSADVNGAINPLFKDVHEKENAAVLGKGIVITKYTGARGKYNSSEASAEFVAKFRGVLNDGGIPWQTGELGKVDEGGGGTVAKYLTVHNMDVLDTGPALLSMHSPFEMASKADIYYSYLAFKRFFEKMK